MKKRNLKNSMIKFKKIIDEQKEVNEKLKKFESYTKLNKSK